MEKSSLQNKPFRIAVVEPRGTGGMMHYAYQLCSALSTAGAQVTLVTSTVYEMDDYPHNFVLRKQMKLWSTIETQETGSQYGKIGQTTQKIFKLVRRAFRGVRLIVEWIRLVIYLLHDQPDIIQFGKIEFPFEAIFLGLLQRNGLVLSQICHEFELREQGNGVVVNISNRLYRWVYDSFSIIFFHGDSNRDRFLKLFDVPKNRLHTIEHGNEGLFHSNKSARVTAAELRVQYGIPPTAPVVLFFGNLMPSKGIPDLLLAFSKIHSKHQEARLIIAGNPSKFIDMDEIRKSILDLNISDATILDAQYIPMENVAGLMEMARVAVYPYLNSTQSGALQVAYTFGRAVIATNVGGLPEAVEHGKSGLIVPASTPGALADAILKFIENPQLADEMGAYAKYLSDTRFSWNSIAENILDIYSETLRYHEG